MDAIHEEREIKLRRANPIQPAELDAALMELGVDFRVADTIDQQDDYLDDARLSLARAGSGLRLRTSSHQGSVLGWKSAGKREQGAWVRQEMEHPWKMPSLPVRARELPEAIRNQVEPFTATRPLLRAVRFNTRRYQRILDRNDEAGLLVLDRVIALHGERSFEFTEVEIELPDHHGEHWKDLAVGLSNRLRLEFAPDSKLQHAIAALGMSGPEGADPQPARPLDQ